MALNLKRGPKEQVWVPVTVTHRDDDDKTYEDSFKILVRTPPKVDDITDERAALTDPTLTEAEARERAKDYLRKNIASWDDLIDAHDAPIPYTKEDFEDLIDLMSYRVALLTKVTEARGTPVAAERKNSTTSRASGRAAK